MFCSKFSSSRSRASEDEESSSPSEPVLCCIEMGNKHSSGRAHKKINYPIPPNAVRPSPPGQPQIEIEDETSVFIQWDAPRDSGGCPIIGYLVQHSEIHERLWHTPNPPLTETHSWVINLTPGATYFFRVIAENILGYSGPSQLSEPTILRVECTPPKFLQELESINALQNERVEFKARLAPGPPCHMTWFIDGAEIFPDDEHVDVELRGTSLLISKVDNDCEIKCFVENEYGCAESVAMLTSGVPPRIRDEPHAEHFFRVGELIRLKFAYTGKPTPSVVWCHNGKNVPADQFQALPNLTILKISNASRAHRGEYMCRIENSHGQDSSFALVTVADRPSPPKKPTVALMGDNSCLIEWADGDDDGGCPVTSHTVEYFRSGWDVWLAGSTTRSRSARIRELIPGSQYIFRVKAENPYGQSDTSETSAQLFIPELSSGLMTTVDESEEDEDKSTDVSTASTATVVPRTIATPSTKDSRGNSTMDNTRVLRPEISAPAQRPKTPEPPLLKTSGRDFISEVLNPPKIPERRGIKDLPEGLPRREFIVPPKAPSPEPPPQLIPGRTIIKRPEPEPLTVSPRPPPTPSPLPTPTPSLLPEPSTSTPRRRSPSPSPYNPIMDHYAMPRSSTLPRTSGTTGERPYSSTSSLGVAQRYKIEPDDSDLPKSEENLAGKSGVDRWASSSSTRSQSSLSGASSSSHLIFEEESEGEEEEPQKVTTSSLTLFKTGKTVRIKTASKEELRPSPSPQQVAPPTPPMVPPTLPPPTNDDKDKITNVFSKPKPKTSKPKEEEIFGPRKVEEEGPRKVEEEEPTRIEEEEESRWSRVLDWVTFPLLLGCIWVKYLNVGVSVVFLLYAIYRLSRVRVKTGDGDTQAQE